MKLFFLNILIFICVQSEAQIPPAIQWQKCLGGNTIDWGAKDIESTNDGGVIMCGMTSSNNGDVSGNHGGYDAWVIKMDVVGNIQWKKCYGGSSSEDATAIVQTVDGGYIFTGSTGSRDGDVSGIHSDSSDLWVVKLDAIGNIQWQRCYGGTRPDQGNSIYQTSDGGYIIGGVTSSDDGDVTGLHYIPAGFRRNDAWVLKINASGNIQWQNCFGGFLAEWGTKVIQSAEGGYLMGVTTWSLDGDAACLNSANGIVWLVKLDLTGNIQWKLCWGGAEGQEFHDLKQAPDGNYIIAGETYSALDRASYGFSDAFILKIDQAGTILWQRKYGGSDFDRAACILLTADGGYVLAGYTYSADIDICRNYGGSDFWVIKLNSIGLREWQKNFGGSNNELAMGIVKTSDGGFIVGGLTQSNNIDVSGNHGTIDWWVVKLAFPGTPVLPTINITSGNTVICPNQNLEFIATHTNGGTTPSFQWQINGVNAATDNSTVIMNTLNNGDIVSCIITSNSPCVTTPTAVSNTISITVDPSLAPANFLPADLAICSYGEVNVKPAGIYRSYLWNSNDTTPSLLISQPGNYWLQVTKNNGCSGLDTIMVGLKECIKGFYMPTAFTPNGDGKNDILKPALGGRIQHYKLIILNRWGQVIFQTSDPGKGWDGSINGLKQDGAVFVWTCSYQFEGEPAKLEKGTVVIVR